MRDRALTAPRQAVAHLPDLLGDMDVERRGRIDPVCQGDGLEQRRVGHGAQRVRCYAERELRIAGERALQPLEQPGEAVRVVQEAALARLRRLAAEAARHIEHRQMGQADAGRALRRQDRKGQLGRIGISAPVGLVVQVMELAHGGIARLQQLDVELGGDRLQLIGADALEEAVHHLAPGPERGLARCQALGEPRHGALESVAVEVRHARQHDAGEPLGAFRRGGGHDGREIARRVDLEPDGGGEARRQQRAFGPQGDHRRSPEQSCRCARY